MGRLFYQYFPIFALLFVVVAFLSWGGLWLSQKDKNIQQFEARLASMNITTSGEISTSGFPSRYDFTLENARWEKGDITIQSGVAKILNYPTQTELAIVGFGAPLTIQANGESYALSAEELRASLRFNEENQLHELILEGTKGALQTASDPYPFEHFVLAWDTDHAELALRHQADTQSEESLTRAPSLSLLLSEIEADYLQ